MATTIETMAAEASAAFAHGVREGCRTLREGAPEWIRDLVRDAAHDGGSALPSDWRWVAAEACLDAIAEGSEDPPEPDVYTGELVAWLAENGALDACDRAVDEGFCADGASMTDRIQAGQALMLREIMDAIRAALEARVEESEDDEKSEDEDED